MTFAVAVDADRRSLPPLGGGLLWAYRLAWGMLAVAALAVLSAALLDASMPPAILAVRLIKSTLLGAVAFVLFWRRQRDPVAGLLALAFLCWTITSSFDFTAEAELPVLLDRLRFLLFALALLLFPDGEWRPRWTRHVAGASAAVFLLGVIEATGFAQTRLFLPLAIACVLAAIASLVARFRTARDEAQRQQLKWVALGLVGGVGLILVARAGVALAPTGVPSLTLEAMFQSGIVLVALGFLVPLLRYRLYDAEAVISRSAAYAVLTAALVAIFAGSEALIEILGQQYLGSGIGQVSGAIAAAVAAVLLAPMNERISNWAEQRFQRDLVELKAELPEFLSEIPVDWSPEKLGKAVLPRIAGAIHATRAALVAADSVVAAEGADRSDAGDAALFPVRLPLRCPFAGVRGWLLIGPRPDGSLYGKDETEAVEAVLPALRRALLACIDRQQAQRRQRLFESALRRDLGSLDDRLVALERLHAAGR